MDYVGKGLSEKIDDETPPEKKKVPQVLGCAPRIRVLSLSRARKKVGSPAGK